MAGLYSRPILGRYELPAEFVDLLGVEHDVVRFEEAADGRFVQLHFQAADADRAVADLPAALDALVARQNPCDSSRWHRIEIDGDLERVAILAELLREQLDAGRTGGNNDRSAREHFAKRILIASLVSRELCVRHELAHVFAHLLGSIE